MCDFCSTQQVWGLSVVIYVNRNGDVCEFDGCIATIEEKGRWEWLRASESGRVDRVSFSLHFSLGSSSSLLWNLQWATGHCEWCPSQAIPLICSADLSAERMDRKTESQSQYKEMRVYCRFQWTYMHLTSGFVSWILVQGPYLPSSVLVHKWWTSQSRQWSCSPILITLFIPG